MVGALAETRETRADRAVAASRRLGATTRRLPRGAPPPPPPPPQPSREEQLLRQRADRVRSLELYLHTQEDALATLIGGATATAGGGGGGGEFVPTYSTKSSPTT